MGTDPKKITKWVSEGSPSHSTPIKIESSNQFVPMNSNPKEFKKVQKLMKEGRRLGGVHAGPESKVLDGVSWEEARQMADAHPSAVGEPYGMKVGAASKGIIQRDFQHHATVFKSPYAKNPFDSVSNEELEEYKRIINKKNKGDSSPASPVLEEDTIGDTTDPGMRDVEISKQLAPQPTTPSKEFIGDDGEHTNYEEETDGNRTFSEGEGDTSRATDPDSALSPKKEKKKKGLRTPSFLKKKKKDKKEKELFREISSTTLLSSSHLTLRILSTLLVTRSWRSIRGSSTRRTRGTAAPPVLSWRRTPSVTPQTQMETPPHLSSRPPWRGPCQPDSPGERGSTTSTLRGTPRDQNPWGGASKVNTQTMKRRQMATELSPRERGTPAGPQTLTPHSALRKRRRRRA